MPEDIFENNPITLDLLREQFHNNDFTTMPVKDYSEYTEEELIEYKKITELVNEQWDSISKELDIPYFQSCYSSDYPIEVVKERVVRIIADNVLRLLNDEKSLNNVWESMVAPLLEQGETGDAQLHNTALALVETLDIKTLFQVARSNSCDEDFNNALAVNYPKMDHNKRYNHSRSKLKSVSLEALTEESDDEFEIADSVDVADEVTARLKYAELMLSNQTYCGDTVNFKTYSKSNKLKKRLKNPAENILVFPDTHEAIINRKTFDLVQKHFEGRRRPDKMGELDKYAGILYCGECGSRLYLHRTKTVASFKNHFICGGFQTRQTDCSSHYIRENILDQIVLENLKAMTAYAREHAEEFYEMAVTNGKEEARRFRKSSEQERKQLETRINQIDSMIRCLYEDRVIGRITPERYDQLASGYEAEQSELKERLTNLNKQIAEIDLQDKYIREFVEKAKEYVEMPKLTAELLQVFIRRIEVFEKPQKYSRTCGNTIIIHYTFEAENASNTVNLEKIA